MGENDPEKEKKISYSQEENYKIGEIFLLNCVSHSEAVSGVVLQSSHVCLTMVFSPQFPHKLRAAKK